MRQVGGYEHWVSGSFTEIREPSRLCFTYVNEDDEHETLVEMDFIDLGVKTEMRFRQAPFLTLEARDMHGWGWNSSFELFDEYARHVPRPDTRPMGPPRSAGTAPDIIAAKERLAVEKHGQGQYPYRTVTSKDGTRIAFEVLGEGPTLVLIGGAANDRNSPIAGVPMAKLLAGHFTVVAYDRRGRGDSGNVLPYAVEREVEDLAALIGAVGGPAVLFGHSSGAGLALEAGVAGLPLAGIAAYEPPYSMDADAEAEALAFIAEL